MSPQDGSNVPPAGEEIHLPGPSAKPMLLALGVTTALLGVTQTWFLVAIGAFISLLVISSWIGDTRRDIDHLPLEH